MTNHKCDKCPEGMSQVGTCFLPAALQVIKSIQTILHRKLGYPVPQWSIVRDLAVFALPYVNMETGELPASIQRSASGGAMVLPTATFDSDDDLKRTADPSPYMIWGARPNNECFYANPPLTRFTGHPEEKFLGLEWGERLHPDCFKRIGPICREGFASRAAFQFVYRLRKADGLWAWIQDYAHPFYRTSGELAGYVGIMNVVCYERDFSTANGSVIPL